MKEISIGILLAIVFLLIWAEWPQDKYEITNEKAVAAIVGEASGAGHGTKEKYDIMVAVAQAIRHRGTLKGVYGVNAKHNKKEPKYIWALAKDAWEISESVPDTVNGADSWYTQNGIFVFYKGDRHAAKTR